MKTCLLEDENTYLGIAANSHALSVRLTHFHIVSRNFWKIWFLAQSHYYTFSILILISRILAKKFPPISEIDLSPIFRSREKCFPNFPVFGKKFPRFSDFQEKVSSIFWFSEKFSRILQRNFYLKQNGHFKLAGLEKQLIK